MHLVLYEAGVSDLDAAAPLFDAYRQFYGFPSDLRACHKFLRERISRAESRVFLVNSDDQPAGFMQLYPSFSSLSLRPVWILYDLFVAAAARNAGIATSLLERARALGIETGASELSLSTATTNVDAQRVYNRLGWVQDKAYYYYNLTI